MCDLLDQPRITVHILSRAELETHTRKHWQPKSNAEIHYIDNLLPLEMAYAKQDVTPCDTLALLVGFSPDPLFQSIWKYRPHRIVLLFNDDYGGETGDEMEIRFVAWVQYLIQSKAFAVSHPADRLPVAMPISTKDTAICSEGATSGWVFQALTKLILPDQQRGKQIVIDITGAKKNMTAGAFLFAAYAGIEISYVDFGEYEQGTRRPLGFTCRIEKQANPYYELGLREWERVRKLYEQYAFRNAAAEIVRLNKEMCCRQYITTSQSSALERLTDILGILEEWDNGDYTAAFNQWKRILQGLSDPPAPKQLVQLPLPQAIAQLGGRPWPSKAAGTAKDLLQQHLNLKCGNPGPTDSIFNHPEWLLVYVHDELEKIGRLIDYNNDYRSAYLRAAGLNELLLKARVAILWFRKNLIGDTTIAASQLVDAPFKRLAKYATAGDMYQFLLGLNGSKWEMGTYWQDNVELDHETLTKLRNEVIHTHLAIPEKLARAAHQLAGCALKEYETKWLQLLGKQSVQYISWQLRWDELCTACGVDFLPRIP